MTEKIKGITEQEAGLAEWRKNNWRRVLNKVTAVLELVIDDPDVSIRDKNEAARTLARIANILTPEKVSESGPKSAKAAEWWEEELSDSERAELDTILHPPKA